jgi:hypothetical protein
MTNYTPRQVFYVSSETSVFKWDLDTEGTDRRSEEEINTEALKIAKEILAAEKAGDEATLYNYSFYLEGNIDGVADILEQLKKEEEEGEKLTYEEKKALGKLEGQLLVKEVVSYIEENYNSTGCNPSSDKKWAVVWFTKETDLEEVRRDLYKRFGYNSREARNAKAYCNYRTCHRVNSLGIYSAM